MTGPAPDRMNEECEMPTKRRYGKAEFAQRGDAVFNESVAPKLGPEDAGKFAAVDIESGAFALDRDELRACEDLRKSRPGAQIWLVRVGSRHLHRFGGRDVRTAS
jgi:hypothetical protein